MKSKSIRHKSNTELWEKYKILCNQTIKANKEAKANYFSDKIEENKDNPTALWWQFKSLGCSNKIKENAKIVLNINEEKCYEAKRIVNFFCRFFTNIASNLRDKLPKIQQKYNTESQTFKSFYQNKNITPKSFKIQRVTKDFVLKQLRNLNPCKSTGIDEIPAKFLKDGANEIKTVITHIINLSIDTGIVPDELKFAKVKPLYKKNSRLDAGNYRPVSILCILSKILEWAVYVQIKD